MTAEPIAPDRLAIIQECTDLIFRFAERNDARDADALAAMFTQDGVFTRPTKPDEPYQGREAIRAGFRAKPATLLTRHIITNVVVTVASASEARAHSYIQLFTAKLEEGARLPVAADARSLIGEFNDVLVRDADGAWRFKTRTGSLAMTVG